MFKSNTMVLFTKCNSLKLSNSQIYIFRYVKNHYFGVDFSELVFLKAMQTKYQPMGTHGNVCASRRNNPKFGKEI